MLNHLLQELWITKIQIRTTEKEEMKKKQKQLTLKEIRLSPTIEEHDFQTKLKTDVNSFLKAINVKFQFVSEVVPLLTKKLVNAS